MVCNNALVNINDQIGIDSYTWSYTPGLVDDIIYYSGDSSSITFRAGAVTLGAGIFLSIGLCNLSLLYAKSVGQDIDMVQFVSGFASSVQCRTYSVAHSSVSPF